MFYVKPFTYDEKTRIVNNTDCVFEIEKSFLSFVRDLKDKRGQLINLNDQEEIDVLEQGLGLIKRQHLELSEIKVTGNLSEFISDRLIGFFKPAFHKTGRLLKIHAQTGLKNYIQSIDISSIDLSIGSFIIEDDLYISNLAGQFDNGPCCKCHYYNFLGRKIIHKDTNKTDWQHFFKYLMQNDLDEISSHKLTDDQLKFAAFIVCENVKSQLILDYAIEPLSKRGFYQVINLRTFRSKADDAFKNYSCECLGHG